MNQHIIDLIIKNAPALREAGVLSLTIDENTATLSPYQPPSPAPAVDTTPDLVPEVEHANALDDPFTYADGKVPTFTRTESDDD